MRFNELGFRRSTRFDGVRINRALAQNPAAIQKLLLLEDLFLDLTRTAELGSASAERVSR